MSLRRKSVMGALVVPLVVIVSLVGLAVANATSSRSTGAVKHFVAIPTITISAFMYHTPASVRHGARIKVINKDGAPHTVTSDRAGKFNLRVPAHSTRYFNAPRIKGTYKYHCTFHSSMHGVLHVG